jgi:hypothetical protein
MDVVHARYLRIERIVMHMAPAEHTHSSMQLLTLKHPLQVSNHRELTILEKDHERLGRLKPEVKVALCIDMTDACVQTCAAGIRAQNPSVSDKELVEELRERMDWMKRPSRRRN